MDALILTIFVSGILVSGFVLFFVWSVMGKTFDHADRLALMPLDDAEPAPRKAPRADPASPKSERITLRPGRLGAAVTQVGGTRDERPSLDRTPIEVRDLQEREP